MNIKTFITVLLAAWPIAACKTPIFQGVDSSKENLQLESYTVKNYEEAARLVNQVIVECDHLISKKALTNSNPELLALSKFVDVQVAYANEPIFASSKLLSQRQLSALDSMPMMIYPRITNPAVVEPTFVRNDQESLGKYYNILPVILNLETLVNYPPDLFYGPDKHWRNEETYSQYAALALDKLTFWLEQWKTQTDSDDQWKQGSSSKSNKIWALNDHLRYVITSKGIYDYHDYRLFLNTPVKQRSHRGHPTPILTLPLKLPEHALGLLFLIPTIEKTDSGNYFNFFAAPRFNIKAPEPNKNIDEKITDRLRNYVRAGDWLQLTDELVSLPPPISPNIDSFFKDLKSELNSDHQLNYFRVKFRSEFHSQSRNLLINYPTVVEELENLHNSYKKALNSAQGLSRLTAARGRFEAAVRKSLESGWAPVMLEGKDRRDLPISISLCERRGHRQIQNQQRRQSNLSANWRKDKLASCIDYIQNGEWDYAIELVLRHLSKPQMLILASRLEDKIKKVGKHPGIQISNTVKTMFKSAIEERRNATTECIGRICVELRDRAKIKDNRDLIQNEANIRREIRQLSEVWSRSFTFIVAADLQYHSDMSAIAQFLSRIDPRYMDRPVPGQHEKISELEQDIRSARFMLLAGDLADGATGSAPLQVGLNFLGVLAPKSPYTDGKEMPDLVRQFRRFSVPIFAVPGNHDGLVGDSGIANVPLDTAGAIAKYLGLTLVSQFFSGFSEYIPVLVKHHGAYIKPPRYDGLVEWQNYFGPLNIGFKYRGHGFVGVNTYNLDKSERVGVGGVVFNWGGGVKLKDVIWTEVALNRMATYKSKHRVQKKQSCKQFLFMHHDPRGATPDFSTYGEARLGSYHLTDSFGNYLTFGYGGLGYSPRFGLFVPFITPGINYFWNFFADTDRWQQEWMQGVRYFGLGLNDDYTYCNNAMPLINTINKNLQIKAEVETKAKGGLSHIFIGHDDVPVQGHWIRKHGAVFPENEIQQRRGIAKYLAYLLYPFLKAPNSDTPRWTQQKNMIHRDGRNATVIRLDDAANAGSYHGFHLVKVDPWTGKCQVQRIALPR